MGKLLYVEFMCASLVQLTVHTTACLLKTVNKSNHWSPMKIDGGRHTQYRDPWLLRQRTRVYGGRRGRLRQQRRPPQWGRGRRGWDRIAEWLWSDCGSSRHSARLHCQHTVCVCSPCTLHTANPDASAQTIRSRNARKTWATCTCAHGTCAAHWCWIDSKMRGGE